MLKFEPTQVPSQNNGSENEGVFEIPSPVPVPKDLTTMAKKLFLLDTNVLIYNPKSIYNFEGAHVGIPAIVLEELDSFKKEGTDRGRNAREVIRNLDALRERGSLGRGVPLDNGGTLQIVFLDRDTRVHMPFMLDIGDNEILLTGLALQQKGFDVQFISKDLNARVKADALGLATQDYVTEHITEEEFYQGWRRITVPAIQLKKEVPSDVLELIESKQLTINEFILVESQHNPTNFRIFRYCGGNVVKPVEQPNLKWQLDARNAQQLMALDLLLDPAIQLVNLLGPAGTGKTFLTLLAGLHQTLVTDEYEKLLVARPVVPLGKDIGYLPGTLHEKLHSWMLPIYDNMDLIVHNAAMSKHVKEQQDYRGRDEPWDKKNKKGRNYKWKERNGKSSDLAPLDELIHRGKISLEAITYMRGRSIPYQFILIDEVQNLTPHEVKTLISRVGEGSKLILAGDPYQIDSPALDFASNGLIISNERFKGQSLFGSVYLEKSERSALSQLAIDLL